jgi:pyruvate,water dikinase
MMAHTFDLSTLGMQDLSKVGGKNASLGEMISNLSAVGVAVPAGFATNAESFKTFLTYDNRDQQIYQLLAQLDVNDVTALAKAGQQIREMILTIPFSSDFEKAVRDAYQHLTETIGHTDFSVAVRSSATAEDLPDASFAGQQETFLNVQGIEEVLIAIKHVFASLFNDRAIAYREHHHFSHQDVAISAGIQQMIRSDLAASGVLFTLDTESGFEEVVLITSSYGLGELLVQGSVNPDEFYVHKAGLKAGRPAVIRKILGSKAMKMVYCDKGIVNQRVKTVEVDEVMRLSFSLTHQEIQQLASQGLMIENHYGRPMDIEWAKDGVNGKLYILQARPETVKSRDNKQVLERYTLQATSPILAEGRSIGQKIGQGKAKIIKDISEIHKVETGDVLVSDMTDPDWEPVMKRASAIVTNRGGRTCHAAIIARELGIPAVVGCSNATKTISEGQEITVSCAQGDTGFVYQGYLPFEKVQLNVETMPDLPLKVMLNVGNPERAFAFASIPNSGVGLARLEFIISNSIGIHPRALLEFDSLEDKELKQFISKKTSAYASPIDYYIERLKEGIATIAAAFYPKPVIVRLSDFKSNEYANLVGGHLYEPHEENPMLGFRGACRYASTDFKDCFALECKAVRQVREEMGLTNVEVMIPFVRTVSEAQAVIATLKQNGLERGKHNLRIIMMCELPSNALLAPQFLEYFDGFSIGSNDLTQLTLGVDRDSGLVACAFDERNEAVKVLLHMAISACKEAGKYIGICGQGPSDHQDFAKWLMQEGIDSVSLNPDSVLDTCLFLAKYTKETV